MGMTLRWARRQVCGEIAVTECLGMMGASQFYMAWNTDLLACTSYKV